MNEKQLADARPYDTALDGADVLFVLVEENMADAEWIGKWRILGCATADAQLASMARKLRAIDAVVVSAGTAFHYANRLADELPPIPAATPLWKYL